MSAILAQEGERIVHQGPANRCAHPIGGQVIDDRLWHEHQLTTAKPRKVVLDPVLLAGRVSELRQAVRPAWGSSRLRDLESVPLTSWPAQRRAMQVGGWRDAVAECIERRRLAIPSAWRSLLARLRRRPLDGPSNLRALLAQAAPEIWGGRGWRRAPRSPLARSAAWGWRRVRVKWRRLPDGTIRVGVRFRRPLEDGAPTPRQLATDIATHLVGRFARRFEVSVSVAGDVGAAVRPTRR